MTLVKKKHTKVKHTVGDKVEEEEGAEREKRSKDLGCRTSP